VRGCADSNHGIIHGAGLHLVSINSHSLSHALMRTRINGLSTDTPQGNDPEPMTGFGVRGAGLYGFT
jgi:hypothetical protein